ncbi:MAG TPA: SDR family NAD(P)-dependent oxidoreductase [Blastocatellia bacterium]|nr:SDR family NAD(P)-dependent oxidoreductase [Blastocatellia bacterium]
MRSLEGRVALVTGGGRGIGRSVALALSTAGARVAVAARTRNEIDDVAAEIVEAGGQCIAVVLDVTSADAVREAFADVATRLGAIDVLVNNAGIARSALSWKTDDELWRSTIETNLSGTFYCMRAALGGMVERKWGRVINIASVAGKVGAAYVSAYVASKHAVIGLTRSAALEVATHGVTVNAICPGYVDTPMTDNSARIIHEKTGMSLEDARRKLESMSPQNRIITCEEVAFLTLALTNDDARGINGQAINVDGGAVTA